MLGALAIAILSAVRIGVYDCLYVALTEREVCEFVATGTNLVNNLKAQFPLIRELSSLS